MREGELLVNVECGPGKVLAGLVKRIAKDVEIANIENCAGLDGLR